MAAAWGLTPPHSGGKSALMNPTQTQVSPNREGSKGRSASAGTKSPAHSSAIDVLNFFLIWITLGLALAWPFQLFLFSYIVLGPLHYLTEINWLDKQQYFLRPKDSRVFLWGMVVLVVLLTLGTFFPETQNFKLTKPLHQAVYGTEGNPLATIMQSSWLLMLIAFVVAAAWLFTDRWSLRAPIIVFCIVSSLFFYKMPM